MKKKCTRLFAPNAAKRLRHLVVVLGWGWGCLRVQNRAVKTEAALLGSTQGTLAVIKHSRSSNRYNVSGSRQGQGLWTARKKDTAALGCCFCQLSRRDLPGMSLLGLAA